VFAQEQLIDKMASTTIAAGAAIARVPQLASASGIGGGLPHSVWRPLAQTFLMQHGIEERDYAREIPNWVALDQAASAVAEAEELAAITRVLSLKAVAKSGHTMKTETSEEEHKASGELAEAHQKSSEDIKAEKRVAELIGRSRKAFGYLFAALPADLRQLVADVPQGYAFGIWSFLERKFRSTEQDSVMALWERITSLRPTEDETFEEYKARVDSVAELLKNASMTLDPGLYASILLWRLHPRYNPVVLALKTGDKLKDPKAIDWPAITGLIAQFERSQMDLNVDGAENSRDRAMAARNFKPAASSMSSAQSSSGKRTAGRDHSNVQCWHCHEFGHFQDRCPQLTAEQQQQQPLQQQKRQQQLPARRESQRGDRRGGNRPNIQFDTNKSEPQGRRNVYAALVGTQEDQDSRGDRAEVSPGRSYLARVLVGLKQSHYSTVTPRSEEQHASSVPAKSGPGRARPFGPQTRAQAREADRRAPSTSKSLDEALRTTAKAVDTGATVSITGNKDLLINIRPCKPMPIAMADKSIVYATHKGELPLQLSVADKPNCIVRLPIHDVYYHERFDATLLSWGCMRLDGWKLHSDKAETFLTTPKGTRVNASTRGKLTILDDAAAGVRCLLKSHRALAARLGRFVCKTADDLVLLHQRTGHASWSRLVKMCQAGTTHGVGDITGMTADEKKKAEERILQCEACTLGKAHRNALGHRGLDKGTEAGETIHMDVFYATTIDPATRQKVTEYCLLGTDGFTELRQCMCTKSRRDLAQLVITMIQKSTTETKRRPRLVVSDLGSEFDNRTVRDYCRKHGIHLQTTPARAKELNGVAEKSVDTVKNHVRAMMHAARMPQQMCPWIVRALKHHVYVWNRTHVGANTGKTPYEAMTGRVPSIVNVGVFGCDAFVHQDRTQRDTTFSAKAAPGIYLGHDFDQNCAVVKMLSTGKVLLAKDVIFREGSFKHLQAVIDGQGHLIGTTDLNEFGTAADRDDVHERDAVALADDEEAVESIESDDVDREQEYDVESIVGKRTKGGVLQYFVKWSGFSKPTWEPARNLTGAQEAVQEYENLLQEAEADLLASYVESDAEEQAAAGQAAVEPPAPVAPSLPSVSRPNTRSASRRAAAAAATSSVTPSSAAGDDEKDDSSPILAARMAAALCL